MHLTETYQITVFTVAEDVERILYAVREVVDLSYGKYAGVSWNSLPGVERFTPLPGASPTHGAIGGEEAVNSLRLEFSIPRSDELLQAVVEKAIYSEHRWQTPVIRVSKSWDVIKGS